VVELINVLGYPNPPEENCWRDKYFDIRSEHKKEKCKNNPIEIEEMGVE
jgi:hypothetical protein